MSRRRPRSPHDGREKARRRALQALYQWHMTQQDVEDIIQQFVEEQDMNTVDVDYFRELLTGTVAQHPENDSSLAEFLDRDLAQIDPTETVILRLATWELKNRLEIPFQVVLDQAVELSRQFGSDQTSGYVNGVLDKCASVWRKAEYESRSRDRIQSD